MVFYVGTIPFFSLLYIVAHLAALQFNGLPSPPYPHNRGSIFSKATDVQPYNAEYTATTTFFILCISIVHTLAWLGQSILCTSCELAPILSGHQGHVPKWCPQSRFRDSGKAGLANMLGSLAPVKDILQWIMVVTAAALIECARREYMRAEQFRHQEFRMLGTGVDFGGPSQGVDMQFQTKVPGVELTQISGPKLIFRAEEEARRREEEERRKREEAETKKRQQKNVQFTASSGLTVPQPVGFGVPGDKDNYYGNGLKRSDTLNYMYESRVDAPQAPTNGSGRPQGGKPRPQQQPTAPPPPGNKDNYYGNAMGLARSNTLNYMYDTRVGAAPAAPQGIQSAGRPQQTRAEPMAPPPPRNKDNYYGNAMGLARKNTLNATYESRV